MLKPEEFFKIKGNSKQWPSDDPKDRPTHTYTCKLCEKKITIGDDAIAVPSAIDRHVEGHYLRYKGVID